MCVLHFYTFFFFSSFLSHFFLFFYFLFSYEVFCLSRPSRPFIHPTSHPTARVLLQCLARYFCVVQFLSPFLSYFSYFSFSSYFSLFIEQLTSVYLTRFDKGRKHLKEGGGGREGETLYFIIRPPASSLASAAFYLGNFSLESRVSPQQQQLFRGEGEIDFYLFSSELNCSTYYARIQ